MSDIIQVICGELTTSFENEVMKAVRQVGINVNKEELLKALELADKLVTCKECKHYTHNNRLGTDWCRRNHTDTNKEGYCYWGERIEE